MGNNKELGINDKLAEEYLKNTSRKSIIKTSPSILPGEVKQLTGGADFEQLAEKISGQVSIFDNDIPYKLGEAQSAPNKWANFSAQLGAEILGGMIEGVGYLGDLKGMQGLYNKDLTDWGNWLSDLGISMKEDSRENFPIFGAQDEGSLGWWLSNGVSVGSTLSLMLPAVGTVRALGMMGKAMGLAAKGVKGLAVMKGMSIFGQAFISRHMENMMESHQIWERTREEAFQLGTGYDEATYLGSKAASETYTKNYALIAQDILQYAIGSGVFGKLGKGYSNPKLAALANQKILLTRGQMGAMYGFDMVTEGAEEAYQHIIGEESRYHALADAGLITKEAAGDRYSKYMKSGELWTSALFGAIGAGVMQVSRAGLKKTDLPLVGGKEEREREQQQIKTAEEAFRKMTETGILLNNGLLNNNQTQIDEAEEKNAFNIAYTHAENGTEVIGKVSVDNLIEAIDNASEEEKQKFAPNYREKLTTIKSEMAKVSKDHKRNRRKYQPSTVRPITFLQHSNRKASESITSQETELKKEKRNTPRYENLSARGKTKLDNEIEVEGIKAVISAVDAYLSDPKTSPEQLAALQLRRAKFETKLEEAENKKQELLKEDASFKTGEQTDEKRILDVEAQDDAAILNQAIQNAGGAVGYAASIFMLNEKINDNNKELENLTSKRGQKAYRVFEEDAIKQAKEKADAEAAKAAAEYQEQQRAAEEEAINKSREEQQKKEEAKAAKEAKEAAEKKAEETAEETEEEKTGPTGEEVGREPEEKEPEQTKEGLKKERDEKIDELEKERQALEEELRQLEEEETESSLSEEEIKEEWKNNPTKDLKIVTSNEAARTFYILEEMPEKTKEGKKSGKKQLKKSNDSFFKIAKGENIEILLLDKATEETFEFVGPATKGKRVLIRPALVYKGVLVQKGSYKYEENIAEKLEPTKSTEKENKNLEKEFKKIDSLVEIGKEYTAEEVEDIIANLPINKVTKFVYNIVKPLLKKLGLTIVFSNEKSEALGTFLSAGGSVVINLYELFSSPHIKTETHVAHALVHELIHGVTTYFFAQDAVNKEERIPGYEIYKELLPKKPLSKEVTKAIKDIKALLDVLQKDPSFRGDYGITNINELLSELANPYFVQKLKNKKVGSTNIFVKIYDAILSLFGIKKGTTAYKKAMEVLTSMVENADVTIYDKLHNAAKGTSKEAVELKQLIKQVQFKGDPISFEQAIENRKDPLDSLKEEMANLQTLFNEVMEEAGIEEMLQKLPKTNESGQSKADRIAAIKKRLGQIDNDIKTIQKDYAKRIKAAPVKTEAKAEEQSTKTEKTEATGIAEKEAGDVSSLIKQAEEAKAKRKGVTPEAAQKGIDEEEEIGDVSNLIEQAEKAKEKRKEENRKNTIKHDDVVVTAVSDDVITPNNPTNDENTELYEGPKRIVETGYGIAWKSTNLENTRSKQNFTYPEEAKALTKFFEDPSINVEDYGAQLYIDEASLKGWSKHKLGSEKRTIADKIKNKEPLTDEQIGIVPVRGAILNKKGEKVSVDGVNLKMEVHDTTFRGWLGLTEEKQETAKAEAVEIKKAVINANYENKQSYVEFEEQRGGTLMRDDLIESNFKNLELVLNVAPENMRFVAGGKAAPGQKTGVYIDSNKNKVEELDNVSATPGAIYALVQKGNGETFPLRLFTQDLIIEEINLVYEIYKKTLQNKDSYKESLSKHADLLQIIKTSGNGRVSGLIDLVDVNSTTLQSLLEILVFEGKYTKTLKGGRLFSTPKGVQAANVFIDKDLFITANGKDSFVKALSKKRRQINRKRLSNPLYKAYIVNNNLVQTTVKEGLDQSRDGKSMLFKQPTVLFGDVEISDSSVSSNKFKNEEEKVVEKEVTETEEVTTDTTTDVEEQIKTLNEERKKELMMHQINQPGNSSIKEQQEHTAKTNEINKRYDDQIDSLKTPKPTTTTNSINEAITVDEVVEEKATDIPGNQSSKERLNRRSKEEKSLFPDILEKTNSLSAFKSTISDFTKSENGKPTAVYVNKKGEVDVVVTGSKDSKSTDMVSFKRVYNKSGLQSTNQFTSKFQIQSKDANFKQMLKDAQEKLPENHEWVENKSISIDGLRVFNKSLNFGYTTKKDSDGNVVTRDTPINIATKENVDTKGEGAFDTFESSSKEEANKKAEEVKKAFPGIEVEIETKSRGPLKSYKVISKLPVLVLSESTKQKIKIESRKKELALEASKKGKETTTKSPVTTEEIIPGVEIKRNALSEEEQLELFDLVRAALENQGAVTNKGTNANIMAGLELRWDYKNNNVGREAVKIDNIITPASAAQYGYYEVSANGQPLGEITPRLKELMSKATGVDATNYDGAIINLYTENTFISNHQDIDEAASAIKYPVLVANIGGNGNFTAQDKQSTLEAGDAYVFGLDGKNRKVFHRTFPSGIDGFLPAIKAAGKNHPAGSYRVSITLRRVKNLEEGMPTAPAKASEVTTEKVVDTSSTESIIKTSKDASEAYPERKDFDIELGKKLQNLFEKLYPEITLTTTENPEWQVASDSVLNQEVLDFASTTEIEEMKAREYYEKIITKLTTPTKFSKKSIQKAIRSVISGGVELKKVKLTNEEIKKLEKQNKYTKESAGLKSFKILAKKYRKQNIALSAPIKLDGVKGPELNILNTVRESIKVDNPKLKSITAEDFIKEVQVFLGAGFVLGFAQEKEHLLYRVNETFNKREGVKHRKISLRYNDEFFNNRSHFPLSPSAWGNITYFHSNFLNSEKTSLSAEAALMLEIDGLELLDKEEENPQDALAPDAVLIHEIQNDFFEKIRESAKKQDPDKIKIEDYIRIISEIKRYPVFLMDAFEDVLKEVRDWENTGIDQSTASEDLTYFKINAYRERVSERVSLLGSIVSDNRKTLETAKIRKENLKRFLRHLQEIQQSGKLNEIVDKYLPEDLTKDIRVSRETNADIISDLLQGFNVVLDNNLSETSLDTLLPGELLFESKEVKIKYLQENPQSQISAISFLRGGTAYQIERGSSLEEDRRDLKSGKMPARVFAKSRKQFAAGLLFKIRKEAIRRIKLDNAQILENLIKNKNFEANNRYASLSDQEIEATFEKLFIEYNSLKQELEKNIKNKRKKIEEVTKDKNNIEFTYANVLFHKLIQTVIKEKGKNFPIYFTGQQATMLTQNSKKSAALYAGPEEVKKGLAEKVGVMYLALKKIPGIKLQYVEQIPGLQRSGTISWEASGTQDRSSFTGGYRVDVSGYEETSPLLYQKDALGNIVGQANIEALTVLIDAANQKQDTLPHEYAHHYIRMWRDSSIVQEGIKRFGSEEALVEAIGKQAVEFVKTGKEGEALSWWRKFTKWILSKLTNQEVLDALTYAVLSRKDLTSFNEKVIQAEEAERIKTENKSKEEQQKEAFLKIEQKGIEQRQKTITTQLEELKAEKHEKTLEALLDDNLSEEEVKQIMSEEGLSSKEEVREAVKEEVVSQMNTKSALPKKATILQRIAFTIKNLLLSLLIVSTLMSNYSFTAATATSTYGYDNLVVNNLESFTSVKLSQDEVNKLDNVTKITKANENTTTPYAIIDKSVGMAHLYKNGQLETSYQVGTGAVKGDSQTTLKSAYFNSSGVEVSFEKATYVHNNKRFLKDDYTSKTNWSQGNKQTGAGIYKIDRKGEYGGGNALFLKNENGISVPSILHRVPNSVVRKRRLNDKDSTNNRFSNGCLNFNAADIDALMANGLGANSNVYVLPDDTTNKFKIVDGNLTFVSKDSTVNRSLYSFEAQPITLKASNLSQFSAENQKTIKGYIQTISNQKSDLMKMFPSVSNEIYNQIATLAYGILGQESSFGSFGGARGSYGLARDYAQIRLNRMTGKETVTPSVGITQTRIFSIPKRIRKKFNINKSEDLFGTYQNRNSAIATMSILLDIYVNQTPSTRRSEFKTILPLLYSSQRKTAAKVFKGEKVTNEYVTNVLKYAEDIDVYLGTKEINNAQKNSPLSTKDSTNLAMAGALFLFRRKERSETNIEEIDEEINRLESEYKALNQRDLYIKAKLGIELEKIRVEMEAIPAESLAILEKMRADSKVVVLQNENDDFYIHKKIAGKVTKFLQLIRVSKIVTPTTNRTTIMDTGAALGKKVDKVVRDFFSETLKSHTHYKLANEKEFKEFIEQLKVLRRRFEANNEHVVSDEITLHNIEMGIAGTTDIITIDNKGVWRIYDMKGQRGNRLKEKYKSDSRTVKYDSTLNGKIKSERQKHKEQLSLYRMLMFKTYGVLAKNLEIIPIQLQYEENDSNTKTLDLKAGIDHSPLNDVLDYSITANSSSGKEHVSVADNKITHSADVGLDGNPVIDVADLLKQANQNKNIDNALSNINAFKDPKSNNKNTDGAYKIREAIDDSTPITEEEIKRVEEIVPENMKVEVVKDYLKLLSGGRRAVGMFTDSMIKISTLAKTGDGFHEAFHGIFRTALTEAEQSELIEEAKTLFLGPLEEQIENLQKIHGANKEQATKLFYEEQLADEFALFMDNPSSYKSIKSKSKHESLFKRLFTWLKEIIQRPKNYKTLFDKIQQGKFNKAQSVDIMMQAGVIEQIENISKKRC